MSKKKRNGSTDTDHVQSFRKELRARTENQQTFIDTVNSNTITFASGCAGTGKTYLAAGLAVEYLRRDRVRKIVISRPLVQAGEDVGTLPGMCLEKLHPYLLPLYDSFLHFVSDSELKGWLANGTLEVCPLGLMRGRTFDNCFVILDEAQNASGEQLKMFLTRIGMYSTMVINGDLEQSDLPHYKVGALDWYMNVLSDVEGIGICRLEVSDIVRNPIIGKILTRIDEYNMKEDNLIKNGN